MSTGTNRIKRSIAPKSLFEDLSNGAGLSSSVSFNQGDLLVIKSGVVATATSEGDASTFLGIARVSVVNGVLIGPYSGLATSTREAIAATPGPQYGVIAALVLKSGDALSWDAVVYADPADGPEWVQASGTKSIGIYQGAAITGDGVKTVEVLLGARYPNDTLKF